MLKAGSSQAAQGAAALPEDVEASSESSTDESSTGSEAVTDEGSGEAAF